MKTADISVTYLDHMGSDLTVVNAARVSFDKESEWAMQERPITADDIAANTFDTVIEQILTPMLKESDVKLINYLAKHKHFSPFNHAFLSFRVKAPIFVARQLVKHKFLPWNEVSRRYVDSEPEFYIPDSLRKRAENVKQGSADESVVGHYVDQLVLSTDSAHQYYKVLLGGGVCPEQARMVLPQNTMTEWVWSGSLGAFLDMLVLRLDPHTQYESRVVAQLIAQEVYELFPVSYKARIPT